MLRFFRSFLPALVAVVVTTAVGGAGCASYNVIPDEGRGRLDAAHEGQLLYVKQSLYAGRFYDDDRFRLVHPRRFEELTYLLNAEGEPIPPLPADEIIPAGTRVRIEKIEWPDGDAVFRRPLYTPRYTTWIYLRVARGVGSGVTMERAERHILLLPGGLESEEAFEQWFTAALSETDPTPWLRTLSEVHQVSIAQKKPAKGMTYEALTAALGFPDKIGQKQDGDGTVVEVGIWGATSVYLRDGLVERYSESEPSSSPVMTSPTLAPSLTPLSSSADGG